MEPFDRAQGRQEEPERLTKLLLPPALSPVEGLFAFLRETVAYILVTRTRGNEINATFEFLSLLCVSITLAVPGGW
jgi:hypothetical protein